MIHDCLVGHVDHQVSKYPKPIYFYLTLQVPVPYIYDANSVINP